MSIASSYARFTLKSHTLPGLVVGGRPFWSCVAEIGIKISHANNPKEQTPKLPVRLDTGAFCSLLPARWVNHLTAMGLGVAQNSIPLHTIAGSGDAYLLQGNAITTFPSASANRPYQIDWFVTDSLDTRGYGLIALRDIVKHFIIRAEGRCEFDDEGLPLELPRLELIPIHTWDRVCYLCPHCGAVAWGRAGLHLLCGDHNVAMPQVG